MSAEIHPGEDLHDGVTFERFLRWWITIRAAICSMTEPPASAADGLPDLYRYLSCAY